MRRSHARANTRLSALDTVGRKLSMEISDADLARRKEGWTPPKPPLDRGYWKLYIDHVLGADTGADLDFWWASRERQFCGRVIDSFFVSKRGYAC